MPAWQHCAGRAVLFLFPCGIPCICTVAEESLPWVAGLSTWDVVIPNWDVVSYFMWPLDLVKLNVCLSVCSCCTVLPYALPACFIYFYFMPELCVHWSFLTLALSWKYQICSSFDEIGTCVSCRCLTFHSSQWLWQSRWELASPCSASVELGGGYARATWIWWLRIWVVEFFLLRCILCVMRCPYHKHTAQST